MKKTHKAAMILASLSGLAIGQHAAAQWDAPLSWNNAAGGSASTTANWAPNAMPAAGDDLTFNLNATYGVTFNSSVPTSRTHTYRQGLVTLTCSSPHTVTTGLTIGDTNALTAGMTLGSGVLNSTSSVSLGSIAGSIGNLSVIASAADFLINGAGADLTVGVNGDASLSITGGGLVSVADQFIAGSNATTSPAVTISGAQAVSPFERSRLLVLGASQSRFGAGGDATVNISSGGLADFDGDLVVSNGSASASTVTVSGAGGPGGVVRAELNVAGDLLLGRNISAGAAGAATMNVNADGRLIVGDTLFVAGDPDGGSATLHLDNGGSITTSSLDIGPGAVLDFDGGTIDVDGGTLSNTNTAAQFVIGGTAHPFLNMQNSATSTLATTVGARALVVGGGAGANLGDFNILSGSDLTIAAGAVVLGEHADDIGNMLVTGAGSSMTLDPASSIQVGASGEGHLDAELGTTVTGGRLFAALNPGSLGVIRFDNSTAQVHSFFAGGGLAAAGGVGNIFVNSSAVLTATTPGTSARIWDAGMLLIAAATVNVNDNMICSGILRMEVNAQLNVGGTLAFDGGELMGHPINPGSAAVDGRIAAGANSLIRAINGNLTLGKATDTAGFSGVLSSTIETGANVITLLDANKAEVGVVTLAGGTLAAANGIQIVPGGTIDGNGTLDGPVSFGAGAGVITATTTTGIVINGVLTNTSGSIDGTKFTFTNGGGWTGSGTIAAKAQFDAGSVIDAQGNLAIGDGSFAGAVFNGTTHLGFNNNLTINDSNGCALGVLTDMDGGDLTSVNGLVLNAGRTLRGRGDIDVTNSGLSVFGTIDPDTFDPNTQTYQNIGDFDVFGSYTMAVNSRYQCDLAGYTNEFQPLNDFIDATGPITLNGDLNISFSGGYTGVAHDIFDVIKGSTRSGTFANVTSPPTSFGPAHVIYLPDRARVILCYANCDGSTGTPSITANDFQCFIDRYAANDIAYANCDGSTGTPRLTSNDFQCFINKVAGGCP